METAYWVEGIPAHVAADTLDPRFDWFVAHFHSMDNPVSRTALRRLQGEGTKVMIHFPFCYKNERYASVPLWATIIQYLDAVDGWLRDESGQIVTQGTTQLIDMRQRSVVKEVMKMMYEAILEWGFVPDAFFIDYMWDRISWKFHCTNPDTVDKAWRLGNTYGLGALKFNLCKANRAFMETKFYVNGWHTCQLADAMAYETFPFTCQEGGERGSHISLYGEFGVENHKALFELPPMLIPAYGTGIGTGIPPHSVINTVSLAYAFCPDAIVVDNSRYVFKVIDSIE